MCEADLEFVQKNILPGESQLQTCDQSMLRYLTGIEILDEGEYSLDQRTGYPYFTPNTRVASHCQEYQKSSTNVRGKYTYLVKVPLGFSDEKEELKTRLIP